MVFLGRKTKNPNYIMLLAATALFFISSVFTQAQVAKDAWVLGFGLTGGRVSFSASGLGAYASIQRNFSEHSGLRLSTNFGSYFEEWADEQGPHQTVTKSLGGHLDFIYYFIPCEWFSPFLIGGIGINTYTEDNQEDEAIVDDRKTAASVGVGGGVEVGLAGDWKLKTEGGFYTLMSDDFDGSSGSEGGGLFGTSTDSFMKIELGVQWYFSKGEPSKICQLYDGIEQEDNFDYDNFEKILDENTPDEIIVEKTIIKNRPKADSRIILLGVNFEFNSSKLLPEAYPILYHASKIIEENPELKIEIEGHCDSIGTAEVNQRISQQRSDVVKNYMLDRGTSESRIKSVGYGYTRPIADNGTAEGRAMNRRIEFKIAD